MSAPRIRQMSRAELGTVLGWAEAEGWNPGLDDAAAFYAADPEGFLVADIGGDPVASISVVGLGGVAFLGLYICRKDMRGAGHGLALWTEALARRAPDGATIGLDGVPAQQARYARAGFVHAHRTVRFQGAPRPAGPDLTRPLAPSDMAAARALDRAATGYDRAAFLRGWLGAGARRSTRVLEREGRLAGLATLRACVIGFKAGPVFAEDADAAAALLDGLAHQAAGAPFSIDAPTPNEVAARLAEARGMIPVFETARMWRGSAPRQDLTRIFGVATLELG